MMTSENILVTGANGQLGSCIHDLTERQNSDNQHFIFTDIDTLDITDIDAVEKFVTDNKIDTIINTAAYTAVDKAEDDETNARKVNAEAVENLAVIAKRHNLKLIHISTDYVFSGNSSAPLRETYPTGPVSVYGKTKLEGEQNIIKSGCNALIIRTSWLYSEYGSNFVKTMLRLGKEKSEINVVCDQIGCPTYAGDLARVILACMDIKSGNGGAEVFHFANEGVCSWYDFAKAIMEISNTNCKIKPIFTHEYATKAQRPFFSVFNLSKIKKLTQMEIPYWRDSLHLIINKLNQ